MSANFKQMNKDGVVKRADARKIKYQDLHVEPGFNLRLPVDRLSADDRQAAQENDESLYQHIVNGGLIPALEVRPREEGGAWIVEGHRRHKQIGRAIAAGVPLQDKDGEVWIDIVPFEGNDEDRTYRVMTSQNNRKLLPIEWADGFKRARGYGHTVDRMAERSGMTVEFVKRMLDIGDANSDVQQMVTAGSVSPTIAAKVARKHGEKAGEVLATELKAAKSQGKEKITAGTMKKMPAKSDAKMGKIVSAIFSRLPGNALELMGHAKVQGSDFISGDVVPIPADLLFELLALNKSL